MGHDAYAVLDRRFQAVGRGQVVHVYEGEGVVVAAGDYGTEGTEKIESFEIIVEEGEDVVLGWHLFPLDLLPPLWWAYGLLGIFLFWWLHSYAVQQPYFYCALLQKAGALVGGIKCKADLG